MESSTAARTDFIKGKRKRIEKEERKEVFGEISKSNWCKWIKIPPEMQQTNSGMEESRSVIASKLVLLQ